MSRARSLLPPGHARRPALTQGLAEIRLVLGRFREAQELLRDLMQVAADTGDRSSERAARVEHARIQFIIGPDPIPLAAIRREAADAAKFYANAGDEPGQGRAAFLLGCVRLRAGNIQRQRRPSERASHSRIGRVTSAKGLRLVGCSPWCS
jgi:hypothetical protein